MRRFVPGHCKVPEEDDYSTCSDPNKEASGEYARTGVIRDGVKDAEEQGGLPTTSEPSVHRESLLLCCSQHFINLIIKASCDYIRPTSSYHLLIEF